jgi:hypothetical protein
MKKIKNIYGYVLLSIDWQSFIFYAISLLFDSLSKTVKLNRCKLHEKLLVFDGLSNNNEIWMIINW